MKICQNKQLDVHMKDRLEKAKEYVCNLGEIKIERNKEM